MGANPFMNPNQRGVELPPGCKDLMDVLKMGGVERRAAGRPIISHGVLSEIGQRVGIFLELGAGERIFSVRIRERSIMLFLLRRGEVLTFNFSVPAKQESVKDAVRRIFQNPKFSESVGGMEYVSVALDPKKDAVARMMVRLLVEGFGVLEEERLIFYSYRRVEGKAEG